MKEASVWFAEDGFVLLRYELQMDKKSLIFCGIISVAVKAPRPGFPPSRTCQKLTNLTDAKKKTKMLMETILNLHLPRLCSSPSSPPLPSPPVLLLPWLGRLAGYSENIE